MTHRQTQQPTNNSFGDEIHPAFGVAVIARVHGSGRSLFQSDLLHNDTITLSIHEAARKRDLNHDWVRAGKELVEIEMSLAQWGSLVSSIGLGSGVPVTIRRTESDPFVPDIPYQPRTAESLTEVKTVVDRMYERVREHLAVLHAAIHEKQGVRAMKDALSRVENAVAGVGNNASFAVDSLVAAGEHVVSQARADIEAHILEAERLTGTRASIAEPAFDGPALTATRTEGSNDD